MQSMYIVQAWESPLPIRGVLCDARPATVAISMMIDCFMLGSDRASWDFSLYLDVLNFMAKEKHTHLCYHLLEIKQNNDNLFCVLYLYSVGVETPVPVRSPKLSNVEPG